MNRSDLSFSCIWDTHCPHPLVIVGNLNVIGVVVFETKADAPLVVDTDRVLTLSVSPRLMELVPRRYLQIIQPCRDVHVLEFSPCPLDDIRRDSS